MNVNWNSIAWAVMAGVCLAFAFIYFTIGCMQARQRNVLAAAVSVGKPAGASRFFSSEVASSLAFSAFAISIAAMILGEILLMHAQTPLAVGEILRWIHLTGFTLIISTMLFMWTYFRAGRLWLAYGAACLLLLGLTLDFYFDPTIDYLTTTRLDTIETFAGNVGAVADGGRNPWLVSMELGTLLAIVFIADAVVTSWRSGAKTERRRAMLVGTCLAFAGVTISFRAALIHVGVIDTTTLFGVPFLIVFGAIFLKFSTDVSHSLSDARQLRISESALRRSERQVDLASEAGQLGLWEWSDDHHELWITNHGRTLYGFDANERVDLRRFQKALHPEDRDSWYQEMKRLWQEGGSYLRDYRITTPDGKERWIAARGRVEIDMEGRSVVTRGVSLDITERKLSDERFREVVEAAPNGMIIFDAQGRITLVNSRVEKDFEYSREELVGLPVEILMAPQFRAEYSESLSRFSDGALLQVMAKSREISGMRKDGQEMPLEISLSPIHSPEGLGGLVSVVNISERKRAERELEQQRNELAHLSRVTMLSELSGSLAHELNQPLTAILSNAQAALRFMAGDAPKLSEVQEILKDIVNDDRRAGEVIQGLRVLLKKGERKKESLDINNAVQSVLRLTRSDLLNASIVVTPRLSMDLPMLIGDMVQLQQVLLNLVKNGCDAMRANPVAERQLVVTTELAGEKHIRICIDDMGPGIPADNLELIFAPFFTTKQEGLGLGLAVCRQIVAAHGGHLWAENKHGKGARLLFTVQVRSGESI